MKTVDQTIFVGDAEGREGNCFQACVASLFGLTLDCVPHFVTHGDDWWTLFERWCEERYGFKPVYLLSQEKSAWADNVVNIAMGTTSRGNDIHACIYENNDLIHDPHPSRDGLVKTKNIILFTPMGSIYRVGRSKV